MTSAPLVDTLLAAHRAELVAFAEQQLGSRAVAEDVVQQAAVRALDAAGGSTWSEHTS
jgi:DNA-directed RNA polymerase specialized sigma24 family protein